MLWMLFENMLQQPPNKIYVAARDAFQKLQAEMACNLPLSVSKSKAPKR